MIKKKQVLFVSSLLNIYSTIADFLTIDITEKLMADRLIYLLGKTNATISFADGIKPVRAIMYKV